MKWTDKQVSNLLFSFIERKNIFYVSYPFIIVLLNKPFSDWINDLLVKKLASNISINDFTTLGFFIFIIIVIIYYIQFIKINYQTPKYFKPFIYAIFIPYVYFRFINTSKWDFVPFYSDSLISLSYLDGIWVFLLSEITLCLCIYLYKRDKTQTYNKSIFWIDKSYKDREHVDWLFRAEIVQSLTSEIKKFNWTESFGIGIVGEWGEGKSYFTSMIRSQLEKDDQIVIIEFNPWSCRKPEQIIDDFFIKFKKALSAYNGQISSAIDKYVATLTKFSGNKVIEFLFELLNNKPDSLEDEMRNIDQILELIDKKVVVIIDDFDRLSKEEIVEVLRLIRNTASFHNTIFIAAYDKNYLVEAITKINSTKPLEYIEKVFQFEYSLPSIKWNILKLKLHEHLLGVLDSTDPLVSGFFDMSKPRYTRYIDFAQNKDIENFDSFETVISSYIRSIRDVVRISNSFVFRYSQLKKDVHFLEFLVLELIKMDSPLVYNQIKNRQIVTVSLGIDSVLSGKGSVMELSANTNEPSKRDQEALNLLFDTARTLVHNSIRNVDWFEVYFEDNLLGKLPRTEFLNLKDKGYLALRDEIDIWRNEKSEIFDLSKLEDLYGYISAYNFYRDKSDFETILKTQLLFVTDGKPLSSVTQKTTSYYFDNYLKNIFDDREDAKDFLRNILIEDSYPYRRSISIFHDLHHEWMPGKNADPENQLLFSNTDCIQFLEHKLDQILKYIIEERGENATSTDFQDAYFAYRNCWATIDNKKNIILTDSSKEMFKAFIISNPQLLVNNWMYKITGAENEFAMIAFVIDLFPNNELLDMLEAMPKTCANRQAVCFYKKAIFSKNPTYFAYKNNSFEVLSDSETKFIKSPNYPFLQPQNCEVLNDHSYIKLAKNLPFFNGAYMIADREEITNDEAINGGVYILERVLDLSDLQKKQIKSVTLEFFVDDFCDLVINNRLISSNFNSDGDKLVVFDKNALKDSFDYDTSNNSIQFIIKNRNYSQVSGLTRDEANWKRNPYGIIYRFEFEFDPQLI